MPKNAKKKRAPQGEELRTRTLQVRLDSGGRPASLDLEARTVEVVAATETPVRIHDWELGRVDEVLLVSGARIPDSGQVPLLDAHNRYSTEHQVGSLRDIRVEGGQLVGTAHFSSAAEDVWTKVREGHVTDFSVGYLTNVRTVVEENETTTIEGKDFNGPCVVVTDWSVKELSVCPIGADPNAKARAEAQTYDQEDDMDKKLRAFLEGRGLAKDSTDEQALAFLKTNFPETGENGERAGVPDDVTGKGKSKDESEPKPGKRADEGEDDMDERTRRAVEEGISRDLERRADIIALCRDHGCEDLADELVLKRCSVADARKAVLENIRKRQSDATGTMNFGRMEMGATDMEKFRAAAVDAIQMRGGGAVEKPADGAARIRGMHMRELAREVLVRNGIRVPDTPMQMMARAMGTDDFQYILGTSVNRSLHAGFEEAPETWRAWCDTDQASDFKTFEIDGLSSFGDLDEIPEGGEYKYGTLSDKRETAKLGKYGKLFAITREALINDDLRALTKIPRQMGRAAQRAIGDAAYAVLTANSAMADSIALFHSSHSNLAGTAAAPSVASLNAALLAMSTQTDISGAAVLGIQPMYFIAPQSLRGTAEQLFGSPSDPSQTNPAVTNIHNGGGSLQRVYDARLDLDSSTAWYLAGFKGDTVSVYFLNGVETPYVESKNGWNIDGVEYKVRIDAVAAAVDHRALYKNAGA